MSHGVFSLCGALGLGLLAADAAQAQTNLPTTATVSVSVSRATNNALGWQGCQALEGNATAQLKCFQDWASAQTTAQTSASAIAQPTISPADTAASAAVNKPVALSAVQVLLLPGLNTEAPDGKPIGCRNDKYSELSKFWELQRATDCDTFAIRGYRPISLAVVVSDGVNTLPTLGSPANNAVTPQNYRRTENKIQLSVRTKIAKGLLKNGDRDEDDHDSLWFGYSQQSYWQLFSPSISRPFRSTDHEPEVIYIYPHQIPLLGGWNYRLSGAGLVHQSNGQSKPLSRSWNRVYLMGAVEKQLGPYSSVNLQARVWDRLRESSGADDNPGIENFIGRGELTANWRINQANTLGVTVRHSLRSEARGSTRIDWMTAPSSSPNYTGLRYHVQFFSGYGDSLIDYNRKRNALSVGLSLVDW